MSSTTGAPAGFDPTLRPKLSRGDLAQFQQTLTAITDAFEDWCALNGIPDAYSYEFKEIDGEAIRFGYIEWGYEPRYDGWEHHEQAMPLEFLYDRAELTAQIKHERAEAERCRQAAEAAQRRAAKSAQEERERAELARLKEKYENDGSDGGTV